MDNMILVNIKTPRNEILEGSQIPVDFSVQDIIDALIDDEELGISRFDESAQPISYMLRSMQQGRALAGNETIAMAQIRGGDTLELQMLGATSPNISQNHTPQNPSAGNNNHASGNNNNNYAMPPPTGAMPIPPKINVFLGVMVLNRHETVSLSITRPIGDLIRQIVGNYSLPARDNTNQLIKYKLQSKALGRFLDERMTLLEAQIPPLDRLTLHRDEIAG
ncbi:MAG TPA: hypothetical protein PKE69_15480 [Pyrinomonadaceae bacterium]|nr:hypothetical protein [Pyrinomonadaceae bacterium]